MKILSVIAKKTPKNYLSAADEYNSELKTTSFVANEAYVDYMASVKLLQNAIAKHTGKPIENWEDAYISENHLSSISRQEQEKFEKEIWEPLKAEVKKITKELEKFGICSASNQDFLCIRSEKHAERFPLIILRLV